MRKTILITGASSGLGAGMAREFARMGRDFALCARRIEQLEALKADLLAINPAIRVEVMPLDVLDEEAVFHVFRAFDKRLGGIDRVIVNAGVGGGQRLGTGGEESNRQTAMVNFVAAITQCEAALELFRAKHAGHLVTMSSMSAFRGMRSSMTTYAATKAGLASLTEGIRMDLLNSPIQATTIYAGYIETPMNEAVKTAPFRVDLETGCRALVKAIEREPGEATVPAWPWIPLRFLIRRLPLSIVKRMT